MPLSCGARAQSNATLTYETVERYSGSAGEFETFSAQKALCQNGVQNIDTRRQEGFGDAARFAKRVVNCERFRNQQQGLYQLKGVCGLWSCCFFVTTEKIIENELVFGKALVKIFQ